MRKIDAVIIITLACVIIVLVATFIVQDQYIEKCYTIIESQSRLIDDLLKDKAKYLE